MDERLERDLRSGLAALLDPIEGSHPRWATSPAARRVQGTAARRWPRPALDRRWAAALAALLVVCLVAVAAFFGWRHQQAATTNPTPTPSPTAQATSVPSPAPEQTPTPASPSPMATLRAWTSLDWSASAQLPEAYSVFGVVAWKGSLIAVSNEPDLGGFGFWSSGDGRDWKALPINDPTLFKATRVDGLVATSSGLVAYGEECPDGVCVFPGLGAIWISHDGLAWEKVASTGVEVMRIAEGPNGLVAVTRPDADGPSEIWTSETGATWQQLSLDPAQFPVASILGDVRATPSGYLMSGAMGGTAAAWWSKDGRSWQRADVVESDGVAMTAIHAGSDGFLATGETSSGASSTPWWSSDGHAWQPVSMPGPSSYGSLGYGVFDDGSRIIAIGGANRSYRFWTSTDGKSWRELQVSRTIPATALPDWTVRTVGRLDGVVAVVLPDGLVLAAGGEVWLLTAH
jgi:hypothetical protein